MKSTIEPEKSLQSHLDKQRLQHDVTFYQDEVKVNETKLAKMKEEKRDPYDIKKFEEVLGESYMMIPDSETRNNNGIDELRIFLTTEGSKLEEKVEWMDIAKKIVASGKDDEGEDGIVETNVDQLGLDEGEAF